MKARLKISSKFILFLSLLVLIIPTITSEEYEVEEDEGNGSHDDYYTSLLGVQSLVKEEQEIVQQLILYKENLERRLELVSAYLRDYNETMWPLMMNKSRLQNQEQLPPENGHNQYPLCNNEDLDSTAILISAHPTMVFKLLRRFNKELVDIGDGLQDDIDNENVGGNLATDFRSYMRNLLDAINFPTEADVVGASTGILRLQEAYQLTASDVSNGKFLDKQTGCKLRASDMNNIGVEAHDSGKLATAVEWLHEAVQRALEGDDSMPVETLLEHLDIVRNTHNHEYLKFDPISRNLFSNLVHPNASNLHELYIVPEVKEVQLGMRRDWDNAFDHHNFNLLCRGEKLLSPKETKKLRCWYSHNSPHNLISPLKFELLHGEPRPVYQIYDLLPESVIDQLKEEARPSFRRSEIVGGVKSDIRTSSVAWLRDRATETNSTRTVQRMAQRTSGLNVWSLDAAEDLQMSCYGSVGGHYIPHLDAQNVNEPPTEDTIQRGDRLATVMFYLSDVELGGGTAFPRLGVAAKAVKGSAVFWYNLRRNGDTDPLMFHGGCPVLYGNKWGILLTSGYTTTNNYTFESVTRTSSRDLKLGIVQRLQKIVEHGKVTYI